MSNKYEAGSGYFCFEMSVGRLVPFVCKKLKHHEERLEHYRNQFCEAEADLRMNGIEFKEGQAHLVSGGITGYSSNLQPKMNQEKVDRVNDCKNKIREHKDRVTSYQEHLNAFRVALYFNNKETIQLNIRDVEFYGVDMEVGNG